MLSTLLSFTTIPGKVEIPCNSAIYQSGFSLEASILSNIILYIEIRPISHLILLNNPNILITTYSQLSTKGREFLNINYGLVCFDEAHNLKNSLSNKSIISDKIKTFTSLPNIIYNRIGRKYGVRILAIKNLKILLMALKISSKFTDKYKII
jgi:hypothetical protein